MEKHSHNRQNIDDNKSGCGAKLRAFIAGLTPATVFKYTFLTSAIVALAATIIYRTASESLHVNIDKVDTASIDLTGSENLGGIEPGGYSSLDYSITNQSTKPSYVFIRVTEAEQPGELIYGYGESGGLTPVAINDTVTMSGRLHCLADAEMYAQLTGDDLDIDVEGCLVYGTTEDGSDGSYSTGAEVLWGKYLENR